MQFWALLKENQQTIAEQWIETLVKGFPLEMQNTLRKKKDPFDNPIGHAIRTGLPAVFDEMLGAQDEAKLKSNLDLIIRQRAVQTIRPAEAVAFIFSLKTIVRKLVEEESIEGDIKAALGAFDESVDGLALLAFDIYVSCREEIFRIRADEIKRLHHVALARAGIKIDTEDPARFGEPLEK